MRKLFLLVLLICLNSALSDDKTLLIEADTISSDNNIINANGNVVVKNDDKKLLTDKLKYDKEKKVIYAESGSKFLINDDILFFNNGNVTSDLKNGNFLNGGLRFNNNIYILSNSVEKKEGYLYIANDTTYYVCPIDENIELKYDNVVKNINNGYSCKNIFSVKSKNTKIDGDKKKVYLKNSVIYFFNIPIFYVPYFYTSKPFINMVSGFDLPHVENLSKYGTGFYIPYVWYFKDKSSLKFDPVFYQYGSFATKFLYKKNGKNGNINVDFVYLFDNNISKDRENVFGITEQEEGKYKNNRVYFSGLGNYKFGDNIFFNFNIKILSDDYLYRDYFKEYDDYLKSDVDFYFVNSDNFNYTNFNIVGFQELRENANTRQRVTPFVVPRLNTHFFMKNTINNKELLFIESNNSLLTTDISTINENRYSGYHNNSKIGYSAIKFGSEIKIGLNLFLDVYHKNNNFIDTSNENLDLRKNYYVRTIPEFSFDLRRPQYLFGSKNIVFEPIFQYYLSNRDYNYNNEFINEDSRKSSINILNLFNSSRFNGLDRREYGERINYGFNVSAKTDVGNFSFKLGQAYRGVTNYKIMGFDNKFSDILSGFGYLNNDFSFDYIMNIDRVDNSIRTNSMLFRIFFDNFDFYTNYTYNYNKNSINYNDFLEGFNVGVVYKFYKNWSILFNFAHDLDRNKTTEAEISINYSNNCFLTGIKISGDNYSNSGVKRDIKFSFYFNLKNF